MRRSAFAFSLLLAAGCSGGGDGDSAPTPQGSLRGDGRTATSLNDPANTPPPPGDLVSCTGLRVVAVDDFDETGTGQAGGVYVMDWGVGAGPYQGLQLFKPSHTPPTYRPFLGDIVDVQGVYEKFQIPNLTFLDPSWKTPQLTGAVMTLRLDGGGPEEAAVIPLQDLWLYDTGWKWLSMLVTVENVTLTSAVVVDKANRASVSVQLPGGGMPPATPAGQMELKAPTITNELFDLAKVPLTQGQTVKRVTGIVTLFNGFHIAPRSAADIVP